VPARRAACAAAILLALAGCERSAPALQTPSSAATTLRLVTWNIQKGEGGIERVIAELKELKPDILFLQEVIEPEGESAIENQTKRIAREMEMHCFSDGGALDATRKQCIVLLARFPLAETARLAISSKRSYGITAIVELKQTRLRLLCVHLAGTYKLNWSHITGTFAERDREWADLIAQADASAEPTIVAGDFNSLSSATPVAKLAERLPLVAQIGATFPSRSPLLPLDHVFVPRGWPVREACVVDSEVSDHRPVIVEISLATDS